MDLKIDSIYQDEVNSQVLRPSVISVDKKQLPLSQSHNNDLMLRMYDFGHKEYRDAPQATNYRYKDSVNSSDDK